MKDLKNMIFYVRSYDDLSIRKIDLKKLQAAKVVKMKIERNWNIHVDDVTQDLYLKTGSDVIQ